eukprot:CAMPEP_0182849108 /NCGR_PEP_ID=MMETSP0006_2-20121128/29362_1 /TAXON_ID=97485 /ORGANISM="Prymnesium parvum, Strain Texoma1" /LENGTH=60 /DNA_ID=CAMNT_0024979579 /DNA_START=74 /DNA_END=256 /DNA_ORIENTATION=+
MALRAIEVPTDTQFGDLKSDWSSEAGMRSGLTSGMVKFSMRLYGEMENTLHPALTRMSSM